MQKKDVKLTDEVAVYKRGLSIQVNDLLNERILEKGCY